MEKILEGIKKGDHIAFTNLVLENKDKLYRIARTKLREPQDIDDAIQETMIQAYTNIKSLRDISKFNAWITKILINKCNEVYRKKKVIILNYEDINSIEEGSYTNLESSLEYIEIMNSLEYGERLIIVLYYNIGYTTKQMSKILSMNENTIKSKLRRAKEKLKKQLEGGNQDG